MNNLIVVNHTHDPYDVKSFLLKKNAETKEGAEELTEILTEVTGSLQYDVDELIDSGTAFLDDKNTTVFLVNTEVFPK